MDKRKQIAIYKQHLKIARDLKEVAKQNYETAARLESEAITALEELGVQQERARKGKDVLSASVKVSLIANLTK